MLSPSMIAVLEAQAPIPGAALADMITAYRAKPSQRLRDKIVLAQAKLVFREVNRIPRPHSWTVEDLHSEAMAAVMVALDRFDATRGTSFTHYAVKTAVGAVRRATMNARGAVRVPPTTAAEHPELKTRTVSLDAPVLEDGESFGASLADEVDADAASVVDARRALRTLSTTEQAEMEAALLGISVRERGAQVGVTGQAVALRRAAILAKLDVDGAE